MLTAEQYVRDGHWSRVPGPIDLANLEMLLTVGRFQEQLDIHGDLGEIGVFAGRYFILIHLLSRKTENVLAIDVFDDLSRNFDVSGGVTDPNIFQQFVRQHVGPHDMRRFRLVAADSLFLKARDVRTQMTSSGMRIFSIDGAHSWQHTVSDLALADDLVTSGGVVIVDDILNSGWPGVVNGVARYLLLSANRRLFPFMIGLNKLWFTTPDYHERYLAFASSDAVGVQQGHAKRVSDFFGSKVVGF